MSSGKINITLAACAAFILTAGSASAQLVAPGITKTFGTPTVGVGGTTTLTFTVVTGATPLTGINFTDTLPAGLAVAATPGIVTTCGGGTITAVAGTTSVALTGLPLGAFAGCTITVNVTGTAPGVLTNSVTVADILAGVGNTSIAGITVAGVAVTPPPTIVKAFGAASIGVGGTTTLTFTITNPSATALTGVAFTDIFPAGLISATPSGIASNCPGGVTVAAAGSVTLTGASLAGNATCTISLNVVGTTAGTLNNVTGAISSIQSGVGLPSNTATLVVLSPPSITKAFGAANININGSTTLTLTITNPNAGTALTGVAFSDTLPAGLAIDIPVNGTSTCGGVLTAAGGSSSITLTAGTIAAGGACVIRLNVFGLSNGTQINTTSTVTSTNAGTGNAAVATLVINPIIDPLEGFQVRYASNLPIGDSVINLTNTGPLTLPTGLTTTGNICVNVYTFDASEELISCCSCLVTPNGLNSLSVRSDLISNTLTPGVPTSIVTKLVASRPLGLTAAGTGGTCNPSAPTPLTVTRGMRAWGTTIHALPTTPVGYGVTETPFDPAQLSVAELTKLTTFCGFIQANGSGFGICKSCRTGGLGADSK